MMKPELAETSSEAGPFRSRVNGTNSAAAAADAMTAGEARPHGIAKQRATTKPELAESSGEAGSPWSRAGGTNSASAAAAVANSADEARPSGLAKHSAKTESAQKVLPGEAKHSGSRASGLQARESCGHVAANVVCRRFLSDAALNFSSHRRTSTGEVSSSIRSHVACVSKHKKTSCGVLCSRKSDVR